MGKKDSDGDFDGGMHSRGHHSNQGKYKGPSHAEFHSLDHGRGSGHDGDHMIGRNGKDDKVGYKGC